MKKYLKIITTTVCLFGVILGYMIYNGHIWLNNPDYTRFPVKGIDVSAYQGKINWEVVQDSGIKFIYIKATEGKDFIDSEFSANWHETKRLGFKRGAYHFFTLGSTGMEQAENFSNVVPYEERCLPPVIDVEFGGNSKKIPDKDLFRKELSNFASQIEIKYRQKPILYVTNEAYEYFIMGHFGDYEIWIRDIFKVPNVDKNREWLFWQYNNRGRINGIEEFVDFNVFNGNEQDFEKRFKR